MCFLHFLQVFLYDEEGPISPFHDVPLVAQEHPKTFHVVIEVTRESFVFKGLLALSFDFYPGLRIRTALFWAAGSASRSALEWKAGPGSWSGTILKSNFRSIRGSKWSREWPWTLTMEAWRLERSLGGPSSHFPPFYLLFLWSKIASL